MHTTQFAIRAHGLLRPVLELAAGTAHGWRPGRQLALVAGIAGDAHQAVGEAELARALGYHAGLVSLAALPDATDARLVEHCRRVGEVIPVFGFYLQPAVGGRPLGRRFWRELAELPSLVAVKIAPFDRYATLEAVGAVAASGRTDIALYTGNDDAILHDLMTPFPCTVGGAAVTRRFVGGLLGQWAIWTRRAVELLDRVKAAPIRGPGGWSAEAAAITDANGAIFDARNGFAGCVPGIHEVLRRQGLMRGTWCLDPRERLSPGQADDIERVYRAYPHLADDEFVRENLDRWLG